MWVIVITIASILALTLAVVGFNSLKLLPWSICSICAGVSGTWAWMLIGMSTNLLLTTYYLLPAAILMGGSVVGIAYQLEQRLPTGRSPLLWKSLFMPAGFALVYGVVTSQWRIGLGFAAILVGVYVWAFRPLTRPGYVKDTERVQEIKKKMGKCC